MLRVQTCHAVIEKHIVDLRPVIAFASRRLAPNRAKATNKAAFSKLMHAISRFATRRAAFSKLVHTCFRSRLMPEEKASGVPRLIWQSHVLLLTVVPLLAEVLVSESWSTGAWLKS